MKDGDSKKLKAGKKALDSYFATDEDDEEKPAEDAVAELHDEAVEDAEEKPTEDAEEKPAEDGETAEKQINNAGMSVLKAANDSVRSYLKATKPLVALIANKSASKRSASEKLMLDSYNEAVRSMNDFSGKAYKMFAIARTPENIPAIVTDSAAQTEDVSRFYEGVPYAIGKKRHDEYLERKGNK
jgi:hypothetical protein